MRLGRHMRRHEPSITETFNALAGLISHSRFSSSTFSCPSRKSWVCMRLRVHMHVHGCLYSTGIYFISLAANITWWKTVVERNKWMKQNVQLKNVLVSEWLTFCSTFWWQGFNCRFTVQCSAAISSRVVPLIMGGNLPRRDVGNVVICSTVVRPAKCC